MLRFSFRLLVTLFLLLPLAACDSNDGDGDGDGGGGGSIGSASITVSGGISSSFDGSAAFGVAEDGTSFSIGIFEGALPTSGNVTGELIGIGRNGDRPAVGTYAFNPTTTGADFVGAYISDVANPTSGSFVSSASGTLTITSSSSDRVAGSFSFSGQGLSGTGGPLGTVTVSGDFSAEFASNVPSTSFP